MACLRCQVDPVGTRPLRLREQDLSLDSDVELEHAQASTGMFLARAAPPAGYGSPRICKLCNVVYYPKVGP